jgi:hypothetical protein
MAKMADEIINIKNVEMFCIKEWNYNGITYFADRIYNATIHTYPAMSYIYIPRDVNGTNGMWFYYNAGSIDTKVYINGVFADYRKYFVDVDVYRRREKLRRLNLFKNR